MRKKSERAFRPDSIRAYFRMEWLPLTFVTISGLLYNFGLLAGPWFDGQMAQCLANILGGNEKAAAMAMLVLSYVAVTLLVQGARYIKRFYVRRFANNSASSLVITVCSVSYAAIPGRIWLSRCRCFSGVAPAFFWRSCASRRSIAAFSASACAGNRWAVVSRNAV